MSGYALMLPLVFMLAMTSTQRVQKGQGATRLAGGSPGVYITYERSGKREPLHTGESEEGIWLRLHNNTRWAVYFPAFGVPRSYGDLGMYYSLEQASQNQSSNMLDIKGYEIGHLYSEHKLQSGRSVLFSVPREHLPSGVKLRVKFRYDWEDEDDVFADREAQHFVFFKGSKLSGR